MIDTTTARLVERTMTGHRLRTRAARQHAHSPAAPAGDPATVTLWQHAATLTAWLDAHSPAASRDHLLALRVMKLAEETGEAAAAYIGMTGQNPRKGVCATRGDLSAELCDVIITALVALATVTGTPAGAQARLQRHLAARSRCLLDRISASPGPGQWDCSCCGDAWYGTPPGNRTCPGGCRQAA